MSELVKIPVTQVRTYAGIPDLVLVHMDTALLQPGDFIWFENMTSIPQLNATLRWIIWGSSTNVGDFLAANKVSDAGQPALNLRVLHSLPLGQVFPETAGHILIFPQQTIEYVGGQSFSVAVNATSFSTAYAIEKDEFVCVFIIGRAASGTLPVVTDDGGNTYTRRVFDSTYNSTHGMVALAETAATIITMSFPAQAYERIIHILTYKGVGSITGRTNSSYYFAGGTNMSFNVRGGGITSWSVAAITQISAGPFSGFNRNLRLLSTSGDHAMTSAVQDMTGFSSSANFPISLTSAINAGGGGVAMELVPSFRPQGSFPISNADSDNGWTWLDVDSEVCETLEPGEVIRFQGLVSVSGLNGQTRIVRHGDVNDRVGDTRHVDVGWNGGQCVLSVDDPSIGTGQEDESGWFTIEPQPESKGADGLFLSKPWIIGGMKT